MLKFSDFLQMSLSSSILDTDTTISVADASQMPSLGPGDYIYLTLFKVDPEQTEIVKCTAVSGNDLTVERAQVGTTAQDFATNDILAFWVNSKVLDQVMASAGFRTKQNINANTVVTSADLTEGKFLVIEKAASADVAITLPSTVGLNVEDGIFFGNLSPHQGLLDLANPYDSVSNPTGDTFNGLGVERTFLNGQGLIRAVPDAENKVWWIY